MVPVGISVGENHFVTETAHHVALREILLQPSEWYKAFSHLYSTRFSNDKKAAVICFGSERCVPPTIAQKLDSQLIYDSGIDFSVSPILLTPRGE